MSIKLSFFITKLLIANVYKLLLLLFAQGTRESGDMAFFGDIFWKLLSDLPKPDLFSTANDRFSIPSNFFQYKVDGFNLESVVNSDCIFSFSSNVIRRA